ncbi:hypothetical protein [Candidatus Binatus soli]|uniref:hypothetical protein n=1 Tax=Candidatus Binatus soli TaxID=1953413 RepID=UPI003D0FA820
MDLKKILADLRQEGERIARAIKALEGTISPRTSKKRRIAAGHLPKRKRRGGITPEGRRRLSLAIRKKKRWAERRKKGL